MPKDRTEATVEVWAHFEVKLSGFETIKTPKSDDPDALSDVRQKRTAAIEKDAREKVKNALSQFDADPELQVVISFYDSPENYEDHLNGEE